MVTLVVYVSYPYNQIYVKRTILNVYTQSLHMNIWISFQCRLPFLRQRLAITVAILTVEPAARLRYIQTILLGQVTTTYTLFFLYFVYFEFIQHNQLQHRILPYCVTKILQLSALNCWNKFFFYPVLSHSFDFIMCTAKPSFFYIYIS